MNWSIDAEWYDANKHLPPVDEEMLCVVKSRGPVWDEATVSFSYNPLVGMYLGSHGPDGWYIDGAYRQSADVPCWTWLPKLPEGWIINDLVD